MNSGLFSTFYSHHIIRNRLREGDHARRPHLQLASWWKCNLIVRIFWELASQSRHARKRTIQTHFRYLAFRVGLRLIFPLKETSCCPLLNITEHYSKQLSSTLWFGKENTILRRKISWISLKLVDRSSRIKKSFGNNKEDIEKPRVPKWYKTHPTLSSYLHFPQKAHAVAVHFPPTFELISP